MRTPRIHREEEREKGRLGEWMRKGPGYVELWPKAVGQALLELQRQHVSRTEAEYLAPHLVEGVPWEDVWATMRQLAQLTAEGFVAMTGEGTKLYDAGCPPRLRLRHLYSFRPVEPAHVQQPGNPRLHWMPIVVDGTSRHEAWCVHCTFGGTSSPNQFSSRLLLGGSEEWATWYAAAQEVDQRLWDASKVVFQDTAGPTS